jgi:hypothetical protein
VAFIDAVHTTLEDYRDRVAAREEEQAGASVEDAEDDQFDLLLAIEDDQTLLSDMNKAFHCIFKYHGAAFLPFWERLIQTYETFLKSDDPTQRQWGLCIMDDVLEYCGPRSFHYANYISQPLLQGCRDASAAIRQAAAYGIGIAAHHGGPAWSTFVGGALPVLFEAMRVGEPRNEENVYATENACAAVAKILHFNASAVPQADEVIAEWIQYLPITNDEEAAPYAYAYLANLIDKYVPPFFWCSWFVYLY